MMVDSLDEDFAKKLNALMERKGLTDMQVANFFYTAPGTVTRWRYGKTKPVYAVQLTILKRLETMP